MDHDLVIPIGQAAQQSGCPASTIRYYEDIGLIARPVRSSGGRRHYSAAEVARLNFIRRARDFGMSLEQVRALQNPATPETCQQARTVLTDRLADIRTRRAELRALEGQLTAMLARCEALCGDAEGASCTIHGEIGSARLVLPA